MHSFKITKESMKQSVLSSVTLQVVPESTAQWLSGNGFETAMISGTDIGIVFFLEQAPFRREMLSKELAGEYGIGQPELIEAAKRNMKDDPVRAEDLWNVLFDLLGVDLEPPESRELITVLRTESGRYGGRAIIDMDMLQEVADKYESDLFIVPSSIHEIIVLKKDDAREAEELAAIIRTVNQTKVSPGEFLSNTPYVFERGKGIRKADGIS